MRRVVLGGQNRRLGRCSAPALRQPATPRSAAFVPLLRPPFGAALPAAAATKGARSHGTLRADADCRCLDQAPPTGACASSRRLLPPAHVRPVQAPCLPLLLHAGLVARLAVPNLPQLLHGSEDAAAFGRVAAVTRRPRFRGRLAVP